MKVVNNNAEEKENHQLLLLQLYPYRFLHLSFCLPIGRYNFRVFISFFCPS